MAAERNVGVLFSAVPAEAAERLRGGRRVAPVLAPTLDEALEWCEMRTLADAGHVTSEAETLSARLRDEFGDEAAQYLLSQFSTVEIQAGAAVMEQGEQADDLAFIESGRASVHVAFEDRPPVRVRTLVAGTMIGELGFYVGAARTATIRAETDCRLIRVAPADIERLEAAHPHLALGFHRLIAKRLCLRIHDKDHVIAGLMRGMRRAAS